MREVFCLDTPKQYVESIEEATQLVLQVHPTAIKHGSIGAWGWYVDEKVVAEAWIHRIKTGWWLKIK